MSSFRGALVASLGVLAIATPTALAHGGQSINYISKITGVAPQARGVKVEVLDRDDRLQVTNRGRSTVVVEGYDKEPYLRLRPGGTVRGQPQLARLLPERGPLRGREGARSPRRAGRARTGGSLDHAGRVDWHDHRIHWMAKTRPGMVKDPDARTKVFDWTVPDPRGRPRRARSRATCTGCRGPAARCRPAPSPGWRPWCWPAARWSWWSAGGAPAPAPRETGEAW